MNKYWIGLRGDQENKTDYDSEFRLPQYYT